MRILLTTLFLLSFLVGHGQEKRSTTRQRFEQAQVAYDAGHYAEALALFNQVLKEMPDQADAYLLRAATREQLGDLQGANTDYAIFLEMKPDQPDALYSLATIRFRLGLYAQAKDDFTKLLSLHPGETNKIYFNQAATTTGKNQIMTLQGPMKPQLFNYLGMVETKLKNYPTAIHWLDSAIRLESKDPDFYVNRGIAKEGAKDSTALGDYKKALTINPQHTVALHNVAILKKTQGQPTESRDQLEAAIESDSSMLYPYLERATQRMEGGYFKGALEDYNKALTITDKDPRIWMNRGLVKEKLNDLKGAFSDYTQAIELDNKYDKAWLNRANVLNKQGRYKDAIDDYTVVLLYNPDSAGAYYNRAIAKQKLKLTPEACEDLKKAESLGQAVPEKMKKEFCKEL
ncbi:tetratricopeptide repeat protein [Chryseolinea lacunae]|uniref:Tetratricopeptide repeat protein n=1 Tax=Chryseolinea lacunae TaxID=2801331 RepID=A0ABS1KVU8_9BACT|nr:tetratricopeptide repeat protein [Chryseolinea lacunae]MBL0743494.1 tetratricopeptide repeat protein [Chryseolinea lacunae]